MDEGLLVEGSQLLEEASQALGDLRAWILRVRQEAEELQLFASYMQSLADGVENRLEDVMGTKGSRDVTP